MQHPFLSSILLSGIILVMSACGQRVPPPAATADKAMENLMAGIEKNDPTVIWHFLPESYQKEANELLHEFANRMDEDIWNGATGIFQKVEQILRTKKRLILQSDELANMPDLEENYDHLVRILGSIAKSDLMDLGKLQSADIGRLISNTGTPLMRELAKIEIDDGNMMLPNPNEFREFLSSMSFELVSEDGDTAVVAITEDGYTDEVNFVRVDGKWIPEELAEEWEFMYREIRDGIREIGRIKASDKAQIMVGITMINSVLDQLLAAKTAEEMETILQGAMGMMMGF